MVTIQIVILKDLLIKKKKKSYFQGSKLSKTKSLKRELLGQIVKQIAKGKTKQSLPT